ncbi:hypothetical protein MCOR14_011611 [Pyricularia oryzae]|nr:hypothetical protein MCOR34_000222 [Pyricularia oryzae]KAI6613391.1 hypothetical protein MCOR14_011611 [Pyricularia oryzae]
MSSDDQNNNNNAPNTNNDVNGPNDMSRNRRASVSSTAFTNLFQRSNSTSAGTPALPGPIATAMNDQRRRLSVSTIGLSGTSPTTMATPFGLRRGSLSTNGSESIDESAIDEDEVGAPNSRTAPATPFTRRMSFGTQAMRNMRTGRGTSPGTNDQGFNWSEQFRSRAESTVTGSRPQFSFGSSVGTSPPRPGGVGPQHDRAKPISEMPAPPAQTPQARSEPRKPDAFQERILKGDFYMD